MKINREEFLTNLQLVKAGLSSRELIDQSSCFVFLGGKVITFNDEIACWKEIGFNLEGAVPAERLLASLERFPSPQLTLRQDENGTLEFRGKRDRFGINLDKEITLPVDRVESPGKWKPLPKDFSEVIKCVKDCVSTDDTQFHLTCVHLASDFAESCDNRQVFRWKLNLGLKEPILVRGKAMDEVIGLGVNKYSVTESWIHFQSPSGLVLSCRKYLQDYPDLGPIIEQSKGNKIEIPKGLIEVNKQAMVHAQDRLTGDDSLVTVKIADGRMKVRGEGITGYYEGIRKVVYSGPPLEFVISPELLGYISERYSHARISETRLKVQGHTEGTEGTWEYVTSLGRPETKKKKVVEDDPKPRKGKSKQHEDDMENPEPEDDEVPF